MKQSQIHLVLEHLLAGNSLTPHQAWIRWGITRLADIVYRLRTRYGFRIITVMLSEGSTSYAQYRFAGMDMKRRKELERRKK